MKLPAWVQKFQISLTAITWMGFVVVCAIFGSYAFLLGDKELTTQNSELQYLREENTYLTDRNRELEQQIGSLRTDQKTVLGAEEIDPELEEGKQRSFLYTIKQGDTIWDIATMYSVDVKALMRWNNLTPRSQIFPGDTLTIILKE
jgi:cell division protein FtsB